MNFDGISRETYSLKNNIDNLKNQYKDIIHYLTNICDIVIRHDVTLGNEIKRLIDRYYDLMHLLDNEYQFTIEDIDSYLKATTRNLNDLMISITQATKDLNESLEIDYL